jgi:hypothetical protein
MAHEDIGDANMRKLMIVLILAPVLAFSLLWMVSAPQAIFAQAGGARGGNIDRNGAQPSIPPPAGWKACPRCQSQKDRAEANAKDKAEAHSFDPHDLSGIWGFNGLGNIGTPPPLTEWGKKQHEATIGDKNEYGEPLRNKDTSGLGGGSKINCDPMGTARLYTYNYGAEFVMLPDRVVEFFELTHTWRTIWTDGRKLPDDPPEPRWLGWTVGHWEGDTLVVESTGYDEREWLFSGIFSGLPDGGWTHSDELKLIERYRRVDHNTLESQMTIIDPKTYTQPWVTPKSMTKLVPGTELWEDFCVPSDYATFNDEVFIPTATGKENKK